MAEPLKQRARRWARDLRRSGHSPRRTGSPLRWPETGSEAAGPDDLDGGAGVREPRRPRPSAPADALRLAEPTPQYLDLVR